jgi:hypothetical protein
MPNDHMSKIPYMGDYGWPVEVAFSYCGSAHANSRIVRAFAKEDAMYDKRIARRLRVSHEFTCSRCGGHEAYNCRGQNAFERYVLNMVRVRPVRCCDCDSRYYAFPVHLEGPVLSGTERTQLVARAA